MTLKREIYLLSRTGLQDSHTLPGISARGGNKALETFLTGVFTPAQVIQMLEAGKNGNWPWVNQT